MRVMRVVFIIMVVAVQLFSSIIVTLSSEQILRALNTPQTLTGLISGSASVIVMVILMAGLFLPQFDRMSRFIHLMHMAHDIVDQARANEPVDPHYFDEFNDLLRRQEWNIDSNSPTLPSRRLSGNRRSSANGHNDWPYGR